MAPVVISSPTAAAAFVLVDLLNDHCDAVATPQADRTWEIRIELGHASRNVLPLTLSSAREWLDQCRLPSASVALDGETHLLRGSARVGAVGS
jgi:hypothetical protein